jgi:hypothetical protein
MLSLGMLIARRDASITDPHPGQRNANPRRHDIAAYTAIVTTDPSTRGRTAESAHVSHERMYADTRYTTLFARSESTPGANRNRTTRPDRNQRPTDQSIVPAGTTHSQRWPLTAAMRSKSAS